MLRRESVDILETLQRRFLRLLVVREVEKAEVVLGLGRGGRRALPVLWRPKCDGSGKWRDRSHGESCAKVSSMAHTW